MQMSTILRASATSAVAPHASKNSLLPPKVPHPKHNSGTLSPDLPSCRYSMPHRMPAALNSLRLCRNEIRCCESYHRHCFTGPPRHEPPASMKGCHMKP